MTLIMAVHRNRTMGLFEDRTIGAIGALIQGVLVPRVLLRASFQSKAFTDTCKVTGSVNLQ